MNQVDITQEERKKMVADLDELIEDAIHHGPLDEVIIDKFFTKLTRAALQTLQPLQWLNDEVINFYFQLLAERDEYSVIAGELSEGSHFFHTSFMSYLSTGGFNGVQTWTRKVDVFGVHKIFSPINVNNIHWSLAVIFMTEKRIQYYDSLDWDGTTYVGLLLQYLRVEHQANKNEPFNDNGWTLVARTPDVPRQQNGSDCGVHVYVRQLSVVERANELRSAGHADYRKQVTVQIMRGFLLDKVYGL